MYCILDSSIALRGWAHMPYAMIHKNELKARPLDSTTFHLLEKCNGNTDLPDSKSLRLLLNAGIIKNCQPGEKNLSLWQRYICFDNRYFPSVSWSITEQCNFSCRHCFTDADLSKNGPFFRLDEAAAFLHELKKCGIRAIALTGGEPLMHPQFLRILEEISGYDMRVFMLNTNGSLLTPSLLKEMMKLGCHPLIKISFDGVGWHDWMRRKAGAEIMTRHAIELCINEGFPVLVQTNVHSDNIDCLMETAAYLDSVGVREMRIIRTADTYKWNNDGNGKVLSYRDYFESMLHFANSFHNMEYQMVLDIWRFLRLNPKTKQYEITAIRHNTDTFSDKLPVCEGNRNMISIAADGELYPCHPFSGYSRVRGISFGNVKKQPLHDILCNSNYITAVCQTVSDLARCNNTCGRCAFLRYCCGGCRAMAMLYGDNYLAVDPMMCTFFAGRYDQQIQTALADWRNVAPEEIQVSNEMVPSRLKEMVNE